MRIPQYVRQVPVQPSGQRLAGLPGQAASGIGAAIAQFGRNLTAWSERRADRNRAIAEREAERTAIASAQDAFRQLDESRIRYTRDLKQPERQELLHATDTDPQTGMERSGYDAELDRYGDWMTEQVQTLREGLSPRAQQVFDAEYDTRYPTWAQHYVDTLDAMEREHIVVQAMDLAEQGRAAQGIDLADLYKDRLGEAAHQQLKQELLTKGAMAELQEIAASDGWQAAAKLTTEPDWQKTWLLDTKEASSVRNSIAAFATDQAVADQRDQTIEIERNEREQLTKAYAGPIDMGPVLSAFAEGRIGKETYNQIRQIQRGGPRAQNDPQTIVSLSELQDAVQRGQTKPEELKKFLRDNAANLTPGKFESAYAEASDVFTPQIRAKNDAVQRAYGQLVKSNEIDGATTNLLLASGVPLDSIEQMKGDRAQQLNLVNILADEMDEFLQKNPEATREDILRRARQIQVTIAGYALEEQDRMIQAWQSGKSITFAGDTTTKTGTQTPTDKAQGTNLVPKGLEDVWPSMSQEEQVQALRLLAMGAHIGKIREALSAQ